MSSGYSLHIGVKHVSPLHYKGWHGFCFPCENDAIAMSKIAQHQRFDSINILLSKNATKKNVRHHILKMSQKAQAGDIVFLSFSGHGGQIMDKNGDETDNKDETWCLFDGEIIDDQIHLLLNQFRAGVRIIIVTDCCHSGTSIKDGNSLFSPPFLPLKKEVQKGNSTIKAAVQLIASCQDKELSKSGDPYSLFTECLLKVWEEGHFQGDYVLFFQKIKQTMPFSQVPNHLKIGTTPSAFLREKPFSI